MSARYITCPICGWTSFSPDDVGHRYCGHCHRFHDEMTDDEIRVATALHAHRERMSTRSILRHLLQRRR